MLIEFGNHALHPSLAGYDDQPKISVLHVPEFDDGSNHPDGRRTGGYTHKPGLSVDEFKAHLDDKGVGAHVRGMWRPLAFEGQQLPITSLPDHEVLLSAVHAFPTQGDGPPVWVKVTPHDLTPNGHAADIEKFLSDFYGCPQAHDFFGTSDADEQLVRKELAYWTRTAPGQLPPGFGLPPATALYTDDGRSISNINDGGGQVGVIGQLTAATGTTATTGQTLVTNAWTGYRIYVTQAAGVMVWGNVISNTNAASSSVVTVDRWYAAATPGGAAGSTPATFTNQGGTYILADGGMVSTWFVGLATGANGPAHGDHTLATNGNAEITTGGGGLIRKIAPYAQTSGVATRSITLTPVFTANGSDSLPATVTTIGVFASMVVGFGGAGGPMKFETALNASATFSLSGDNATITETVTGS